MIFLDTPDSVITNNVLGLCTLSVLLFITNTILNWKMRITMNLILKKLKSIEDFPNNFEAQKAAISRLQEGIVALGEVKNNMDNLKQLIIELKIPINYGSDSAKSNQVMIDGVIIPFIEEMRDTNKNQYQLLNNITSNINNIANSLNTVFQGLISTLKR